MDQVVRDGLVHVRPADPERVLDPGHRAGTAFPERPESLAQPVELLVRPGLETDVVGDLAVAQHGATEGQRPRLAVHGHVVVLLGQQHAAAAVLEPHRPRVRGDHRDQVAAPRTSPAGASAAGSAAAAGPVSRPGSRTSGRPVSARGRCVPSRLRLTRTTPAATAATWTVSGSRRWPSR